MQYKLTLIFSSLYFFLTVEISSAQIKDAQLWENITSTIDISRKYAFTFNQEGRFSNNMSVFHYAYIDLGLERKIQKHFKVSINYVFVWKKSEELDHTRHQWYVAAHYKTKFLRRFEFQFRGMFQQQYQDLYTSELGKYPENYIRSKFVLRYNFDKYPLNRFTPYLASEIYYHIDNNTKYGSQFDRIRYFIGSYYNFNKLTSLEAYFLYENNFNVNNPPKNYVYGIGFEHDF